MKLRRPLENKVRTTQPISRKRALVTNGLWNWFTARRVAVSIRFFDLQTRAVVWEGVVEESESESRTYSPQRPDNAGEFCLSIPLEIMLKVIYQPPAAQHRNIAHEDSQVIRLNHTLNKRGQNFVLDKFRLLSPSWWYDWIKLSEGNTRLGGW